MQCSRLNETESPLKKSLWVPFRAKFWRPSLFPVFWIRNSPAVWLRMKIFTPGVNVEELFLDAFTLCLLMSVC